MLDRRNAIDDFETHLAYCHNLSAKEKREALEAATELKERELRQGFSANVLSNWRMI